MKLIKVGAAVLNQTPRDWSGNHTNIIEAIKEARRNKVTILCLPEMTITGYGLEDDLFCADVARRAILKLVEIANYLTDTNMIVSVGLPILFNNTLYNAVATIVNGHVAGFTCKQHLAGDGIHYEPRHFKPWPAGVVQQIEIPELRGYKDSPYNEDASFPIGDVHFNIGGVKVGYEICEDAWVANRPGAILATKGVDIYLNPSASHFAFGKLNTRKNFVVDGSRAFNATYVYANLLGNESGRVVYDGGALIASGGNLVAQGRRFSYENYLVTSAVVDVSSTRTAQVRTTSFQPNVENYNDGCVMVDFTYPEVETKVTTAVEVEEWEFSEFLKHEECTRAIGLALMDYMRKSHTRGFVISLSGGCDSTMVTYLCSMGIRLAVAELGVKEFRQKYCPWATEQFTTDGYIHQLITTAYQATKQSGDVTREAAKQVATVIGGVHYEFEIQDIVDCFLKLGKQVKGTDLTFKEDDITMQNLQARSRAPGIWMIANMKGTLLLTTSNMSEAAVGYATMDGDTAGSVAPIAGLSKVYIREYLRWVENYGTGKFGAFPTMGYVNSQSPTAELRPKECKQTDEDDLMPYALLHRIETMMVKNRYSPVEIYLSIRKESGYSDRNTNNQLIKDITKFFQLFSRNQWKRERYALSFHMDDHNLDPRAWCRTPILTGGYEEELLELVKHIL